MLSQTAEYAMRAMACLALTPDRLVSTPELAEQAQVPANYLAKVLQQLAGAGLIGGRRGVGGGYRLARPAAQIRMIEVINAVGSLRRITTCPLGAPGGNGALCPVHRITDRAVKAVIEVFDQVTLKDLVGDQGQSRPLCDTAAPRLSIAEPRGRKARLAG